MQLKDAMAALANGKAKVVDVARLLEKSRPGDLPPAITEDYQRQVELG